MQANFKANLPIHYNKEVIKVTVYFGIKYLQPPKPICSCGSSRETIMNNVFIEEIMVQDETLNQNESPIAKEAIKTIQRMFKHRKVLCSGCFAEIIRKNTQNPVSEVFVI